MVILAHLRQLGIDVPEFVHSPLGYPIWRHPAGADHGGDLIQHPPEVTGPDQGQQRIEHAGQHHNPEHVEGGPRHHGLDARRRQHADQHPVALGQAAVGHKLPGILIQEDAILLAEAGEPARVGHGLEQLGRVRVGQHLAGLIDDHLVTVAQVPVQLGGEGGQHGIHREHPAHLALLVGDGPRERDDQVAVGVVVIGLGPDHLAQMLAGQLIPGAHPGIEARIRLPFGVDQHLALGGADIDVDEVCHDPLVEAPLLEVGLGIVQSGTADVVHLYLVVDEGELAFHLVQIGFDEDVTQLVVGGEQALLQLLLQAALHVQVVDTPQHQHRDEQQQQAQTHPGNQGPGLFGDCSFIQP
ncbi:hypothetical protein D3C84_704600 [compost metagenome]